MPTPPPDQPRPPDPTTPTPPPTRRQYPIPTRILRAMAFTLPRPGDDEPETAGSDEIQTALDTIAALDPANPIEAILAIQIIAARAGALDSLPPRLPSPAPPPPRRSRHRVTATALTRTTTNALRQLKQQKQLPVGPPRDWGDTT